MNNRERHYWDSVSCISFLRGDPDRIDACRKSLEAAEMGAIEIVLSSLTIAEVLHLKGEPPLPPEHRATIRNFFRRQMFTVVTVDRLIAEHAQDLFYDHGIKPKDAIHVASALRAGAGFLDTFDRGLIAKSGTVGGQPQLIIQPPLYQPPSRRGPRVERPDPSPQADLELE